MQSLRCLALPSWGLPPPLPSNIHSRPSRRGLVASCTIPCRCPLLSVHVESTTTYAYITSFPLSYNPCRLLWSFTSMRCFAPSMLEAPLAYDIQSTGYLRPSQQQGQIPCHEIFALITIFCPLDRLLFPWHGVVGGTHSVPTIANLTIANSTILTPTIATVPLPIISASDGIQSTCR